MSDGSAPVDGSASAPATARPTAPAAAGEAPSLLVVATIAHTVKGFLLPFAAHYRALGWRVDVAANGAAASEELHAAFDHAYELPLSRSILDVAGILRAERELERVLETEPAIVHAHTPIAGFVARAAVRRRPAAVRPAMVYTAHGFHFHRGGGRVSNAIFRTAEQVAGRWTDRLVVINDEDEAAALAHRVVPRRRLVHMPGIGVDTGYYDRAAVDPDAPARLRASLGIPSDAPVFTVVAEHAARKRVFDAIAGLAAMRHADAHLLLAGEGPDTAALVSLATGLGVADRTHVLGALRDVRPAILAAAALVLVSDREGLARSVMEAMSLGVPVVVSDARGNPELAAGGCGLVAPVGDVTAIAAAMDRVVDEPALAAAMGARGRARIVEGFSLDIVVRRHDDLYRAVLAERDARLAARGRG